MKGNTKYNNQSKDLISKPYRQNHALLKQLRCQLLIGVWSQGISCWIC